MSLSTVTGRVWDEAADANSDDAVRRFDAAWRAAPPSRRPDPLAFVAGGSPGARLTLLRSDLGLRWESGEKAEAARYRGLGLPDDVMVALAYEEFSLREEHGESPAPSEFYVRYPEIAKPLRRVLEIHDLVGSAHAASTASLGSGPSCSAVAFPEAGQTIAGFHLVEELGRGGFARVFLAKERQLGDRPVALKVARAGSREPQTLARLQHTHIVPVHSYRTDPATGLHLLCMPYFGRVTLAHVLADPAVKDAIGGSALVAALDRLDGEGAAGSSVRTTGRSALISRPFARAIAWWGARLAEALQHAHDRGVLHRDVKPSNVLVTADGMPMLLDFNLAHEPFDAIADAAPAALGGTLAYMSPEHLEALAEGRADGGDGRSDIYALGVVLFEAMGARPFGPPPESRSVPEALLRAAEHRKAGPPRLRDRFPEAPQALCAVVAKCLAPDPADRYPRAADLAEDLQAVADDLPLAHAREPVVVRIAAKVRRHRRAMAATATVLVALGVAAFYFLNARMADDRLRDQIRYYFAQGDRAETDRNFVQARQDFETAGRLAEGSRDLASEQLRANRRAGIVEKAARTTADAEHFFARAEPLRFGLLGFDGDRPYDGPSLDEAMEPFFVVESSDWTDRGELFNLGERPRARLVREVHELLFLDALHEAAIKNDPTRLSRALERCDLAMKIRDARLVAGPSGEEDARSLPHGPWEALRKIVVAEREGSPPPAVRPPPSSSVGTAWECYGWGRLLLLEGQGATGRAVAWLDRAARREPGRFWLEFDVAYQADRAGLADLAFEHYGTAVNLRSDYPRARLNRARLHRQRGAWSRARDDLERALKADDGLVEARLELGLVEQTLGNSSAARAAYDDVIATENAGIYRRGAILNLAKLDFVDGRAAKAVEALDGLLRDDPRDATARQARAVVALRGGDPARAEADLDLVLLASPSDPEALGLRALARLALGRPDLADADATKAARLDPSPRRERLVTRTGLARGKFANLRLDDPEAVRLLPSGGRPLAHDLRAASAALANGTPDAASRSTRAVILCALGDAVAAESEASAAIAASPFSPRAWLVRARIRRAQGDHRGAIDDVVRGMELEPDDPRLAGLLGLLRVDSGDAAGALVDLDRLSHRTGGPALDRARAVARNRIGRGRQALPDWNRALENDPDDPSLYLGRAHAFIQLANWDAALADLERAAASAAGQPETLAAIAVAYARCIPNRPGQWGRMATLLRQASFSNRGE